MIGRVAFTLTLMTVCLGRNIGTGTADVTPDDLLGVHQELLVTLAQVRNDLRHARTEREARHETSKTRKTM